jgi:hypothetical protein
VLPGAAGDRDEHTYPGCSLAQFTQSGPACLASARRGCRTGGPHGGGLDRTAATVNKRDVSYQRGFPLAADPGSLPVDRGHLIPNLSGGEFGPNIFRVCRMFWTWQAGDAEAARDQYAAPLPDRPRVSGPDHPETLIARANLAYADTSTAAGALMTHSTACSPRRRLPQEPRRLENGPLAAPRPSGGPGAPGRRPEATYTIRPPRRDRERSRPAIRA